jgi:hypothetical protein
MQPIPFLDQEEEQRLRGPSADEGNVLLGLLRGGSGGGERVADVGQLGHSTGSPAPKRVY